MTEKKVASKTVQNRVIKLVENLLIARRNGNVKREQAAYERLEEYCEKQNIEFSEAMDFGKRWLKKNKISPQGAW